MTSDTRKHDKAAPWGVHLWNHCYRGGELIRQDCDICGVTPDEWERRAVVTVHVTEEDIRQATESADPTVDPVELALARDAGLDDPMIPGFPFSRVVGDTYNFELPDKAAAFVRRFVKGKPVKPIAFKWWPGRGYIRHAVHRVARKTA
jgi:hypothetical protein